MRTSIRRNTKKSKKLRQLYNHANVLHNIAWEARFAFDKEVNRLVLRCKSKEDFLKLQGDLQAIFHVFTPLPDNPKPKRSYSHSGNIDVFGFYAFQHAAKEGWLK